jgi:hypothetical protein
MPNEQIVFNQDPKVEHAKIQSLYKEKSKKDWEFGARLSHFKVTGGWQLVSDPPYSDWTDYVVNGLNCSPTTAYKYMSAAWFPTQEVEREGADKLYFLKKITDVTVVDETPEQALALELPLVGGGVKPFRQMTVREIEQAYKLIRNGEGRANRPEKAVDQQVEALKQAAEEAVSGMLEPYQIAARKKRSGIVIDVKGVPSEQAVEIFSALADALATERKA